MRVAAIVSHPIQYHAPLFRELARRVDLTVFFAHRATPADQAKAGFGVDFAWDVDLVSGFDHVFLCNVAQQPGLDRFAGCDTPEIGARLDDGQFSAVLVQGWHLKSYLQAIFAAKRRGLPVLARGDSQLHTPRSRIKLTAKAVVFPAFLRLFDAALYVGLRSRAYWSHYRYPESRLYLSSHCVDTNWFGARATTEAGAQLRDRLGISPGAKVVLFAGKLVPFKRPLDLIEAAARLKQEACNVAVLVAGSGELDDAMKQLAARHEVPLHRLGFCNQSEMPAVYAAADILVLPSDGRETWGLVANEALACGRPVVLSDAVGAAPDLAADGTAGRVFPMGDISGLAHVVRDVLMSPPHPKATAAKSHGYTPVAAVDGIEAALAATVRSTAPKRPGG